jgi:prolyl-tRNA editing enzyme YbaK/EbsC (Cys-tRNA(Pro) deacylase)
MSSELSASARRVQGALEHLGFRYQVVELPRTTRSAAEAAEAVGCQVAQIAKALVFKGRESGQPILVIASGANRVDERALGELVGEPIGKADADFVRQATGFAIGGVAPVGHVRPVRTFIDEDLLRHDAIWAAAGTPNAVFRLAPADLVAMTGGRVVPIA